METCFIILCILIAIGIPCYDRRIRTLKEARVVSKVYLFFAILLFLFGIGLFAFTREISYTTSVICEVCNGSGIKSNGKPCIFCMETGEYVVSDVLYSIPLLYPGCMVALGIYTILLRFPLLELIVYLEEEEEEFPDLSFDSYKRKPHKH